SADTTIPSSTSVFVHVSNFTIGGYHNGSTFVETGEVAQLIAAGTNMIHVSAPNDDWDRGVVDREWAIDYQGGSLMVTDDDTDWPAATLRYVGDNYTFGDLNTGPITDGQMTNGLDTAIQWYDRSGLFITNNNLVTNFDGNLGNVGPNWDLMNPSGTFILENEFYSGPNLHSPAGNGSFYTTAVYFNVSAITVANNATGTWTIRASGQDNDSDRGFVTMGDGTTISLDRAVASDYGLTFLVVDDDEISPFYASNANTAPLGVWIGASNVTPSAGTTNAIFVVTDGDLARVGGTNLLLNPGFEDGLNNYVYGDNVAAIAGAA
ncbi:MAG: hypothetical protein V2A34_14315, partial [Lentisphaerota bacterium]